MMISGILQGGKQCRFPPSQEKFVFDIDLEKIYIHQFIKDNKFGKGHCIMIHYSSTIRGALTILIRSVDLAGATIEIYSLPLI